MQSKKLDTRQIRKFKSTESDKSLQMLTCYDFQTAQLLNETALDLILVGDSVGNVILGYKTSVEVTLDEMIIFAKAVKRGAPDKFIVADLPFGTYSSIEAATSNAIKMFQSTGVEALKIEGGQPLHQEIIQRLTQIGIPIMGHIGLLPQSVHQQGGYYTHGKNSKDEEMLIDQAQRLEKAGAFCLVLECIKKEVAQKITSLVNIPTIGIGSGSYVDGQVLVINDLLKLGQQRPPSFCQPIADLYEIKKDLINQYLGRPKYLNETSSSDLGSEHNVTHH